MNLLLPSLVRMQVARPGARHWPRIWLPLFLLWPLWLIALFSLFAALVVLGVAVSAHPLRPTLGIAWKCTRELNGLACALRGTRCDIESRRDGALSLIIL